MIGGLQYLIHTRLYIENVVGIVARFQDDHKESHYAVVKRIFKYSKGTPNYGLSYDISSDFNLCAYTNLDWVDDMDEKKRTSGGEFFLG